MIHGLLKVEPSKAHKLGPQVKLFLTEQMPLGRIPVSSLHNVQTSKQGNLATMP